MIKDSFDQQPQDQVLKPHKTRDCCYLERPEYTFLFSSLMYPIFEYMDLRNHQHQQLVDLYIDRCMLLPL